MKRRWWAHVAAFLCLVIFVLVGWTLVAQRLSDAPLTSMIPGGLLRAAPLVTERDVDWPTVLGAGGRCVDGVCAPMAPIELQLAEPPSSRYVGIMVDEGELYLPCDLGFMWARFSGI